MSSSTPWLTRLQPHCLPCSSSNSPASSCFRVTAFISLCLENLLPDRSKAPPVPASSLSPLPYLFSSSKRSPSLLCAKLGPPTPSLSPFPCTCCTFFHSGFSPLTYCVLRGFWYLLHRFTPTLFPSASYICFVPACQLTASKVWPGRGTCWSTERRNERKARISPLSLPAFVWHWQQWPRRPEGFSSPPRWLPQFSQEYSGLLLLLWCPVPERWKRLTWGLKPNCL